MSTVPEGWETVALGDAARWFSGGTPLTSEPSYWGGSIPWISSGSLTRFMLRDSVRRVTEAGATAGTRVVEPGTTLFVVRGMSLKTEFRVGVAMRKMTFGQDCKALVAVEGIDPWFLAYAVRARSDAILDLVEEAGHGTGVLPTDQIKRLEIGVPSLQEQREIVATLRALDDKIEANERLTQVADATLEAAFRSVVDVELDDKGNPPEGWTTTGLTDLGRFVNGRAFTKDATGSGRMVVRIAELSSGPGASTIYNDVVVKDEHIARPGDILFAWSGTLGVHRWYRDDAIVNQHIFKVIPHDDVPAWFLYQQIRLHMPWFQGVAKDKATTMGHIKRHHLDDAGVLVPPFEVLADLDADASPLWERALNAERQNLALAALRDTLMPALLSGQVRVPGEEPSTADVA